MDLFEIAATTVIGVIGWVGRQMHSRLTSVQTELDNFKLHVVTYYVDKNDFKDAMRDIKDSMKSLERVVRDDVSKILDKIDEKVDK